jgi:hypothetical protein
VFVDTNGLWRYHHDGHLYDGYALSPTQRDQATGGRSTGTPLDPSDGASTPTGDGIPSIKTPKIRVRSHDLDNQYRGAHIIERHGPEIPLRREDVGPGERSIEGRIYGDTPWDRTDNWSYRWIDNTTWQRAIQTHIQANWANITQPLTTKGFYRQTFDAGYLVGEGFYNSGMHGMGPRKAVYHQTSYVTIRIEAVLDSDPLEFFIVTAYPDGKGFIREQQ